MRYYCIVIHGAPAAFQPRQGMNLPDVIWCSAVNGRNDPEAQQIELSIEEYRPDAGTGNPSTVTIHGIAWEQMKQAANLVGRTIEIYGGMLHGLPLATHQEIHTGLLIQGTIIKCWGNWIGTEMSLGLVMLPSGIANKEGAQGAAAGGGGGAGEGASSEGGGGSIQENSFDPGVKFTRTGRRSIDTRPFPRAPTVNPQDFGGFDWTSATSTIGGMVNSFFGGGGTIATPLNMIHNMMPNMPLSSAIKETLSRAFPNANLDIQISSMLKLGYQEAGMYQNLVQYASRMKELSRSIMGIKNYGGVHMSSYSNKITVWDDEWVGSTLVVDWMDLIGQPTWVLPNMINFKTVMRGDIHVPQIVMLPNTLFTTQPGALNPSLNIGSPQHANLTFGGTFQVTKVLHIGDFRNPDGANWSSNYEAIVKSVSPGRTDTPPPPTPPGLPERFKFINPFDPNEPPNVLPPPPGSRLRNRSIRKY